MLVQDVMHREVLTVEADAPLAEVYQMMRTHKVRHLPVMQEGRLVGIVTDRDLRFATSVLHPHPFPVDEQVEGVMTRHPHTASPLEPIEAAARRMHDLVIGCLPVVEDNRLVGILTVTDLLQALVDLMGVTRPGGRVAVQFEEDANELPRLTAAIAAADIRIRSVLSYPEAPSSLHVILRVDTTNTPALAQALREDGFDVTWPPEASWSP